MLPTSKKTNVLSSYFTSHAIHPFKTLSYQNSAHGPIFSHILEAVLPITVLLSFLVVL